MPGYLEITLDVATALSIIGAAATFLTQMRRQRQADLVSEKWEFLKGLADEIRNYKREIVGVLVNKDDAIMRSEDVHYDEETCQDTAWMDIFAVLNRVTHITQKCYFYAEYDLRKRAEWISAQYKDPRIDISEQIESFRQALNKDFRRRRKSVMVPAISPVTTHKFYYSYLLRDIGLRTPGNIVENLPYGTPPDNELKRILAVTNGDYTPREYYKKEDQPPTVFDVLDNFADSIMNAIQK